MSKVATPKRDNASPAAGRGKPTSYGSPAHIRAPRCSGNDSPQAVSLGSGSPERSRRVEDNSRDSASSRRVLHRPQALDDMARPILPYEPTPARIDVLSKDVGTTQDLGVAIGTEVRKTVNELEQSLARREQENLNLKILVRELEEERRAEDLSARLLNEAAVKVQSNWRSIDGAILQESQAFTRTPERAFRASASVDVQSMPRPPVQPANIFGSDPSLNHVGGSGQRDVDIKISRYHEETRDLRAQLNAVTTKLAQSEASCNLAAAQVEKADEQVLSLSRQLIELKSELELASRCRASDQVEILQLRKAREQMEAAHREREAIVVELREQRDRDAEAAREMSRQVDELKCRGERDVQEEGAREQQREAEYQRRQQVVERGHQAEIEELARQNSEYRATLIQQEASIAELKTHLTRDSALVGQLRCRVEQQEGLLVEHSAQLCEKEAHIADLERELRQQQAWESLGAPALKPDRAPAAQGGCVGDAGGRGRGSGARGEVGAENEVVALDQHVLDLRADKEKLASLLQAEQQITRSLVRELSESHRLVLALQQMVACASQLSPVPFAEGKDFNLPAQSVEIPGSGAPASPTAVAGIDGSREANLDRLEGAAAILGAAAAQMREVQEGLGGVAKAPLHTDSLRHHLDAAARTNTSRAQERAGEGATRGAGDERRDETLTVTLKSDGERAPDEATRGGGAREFVDGRRTREAADEWRREGEEGNWEEGAKGGRERCGGGEPREPSRDEGVKLARKLSLETSPPHTAAIQREADLRRRISDLERAGREEQEHGTARQSPFPVHKKTYTATRSVEVEALLKDVAQLLQATPLIPRRTASHFHAASVPGGRFACALENSQARDTGGGSDGSGGSGGSGLATQKERVERELVFGHAGAGGPLDPTPPPESAVGAQSRSLSRLSSRPTAVHSSSTSHERSMAGDDEQEHAGLGSGCGDALGVALQRWREREEERNQRGERHCGDDANPWERA